MNNKIIVEVLVPQLETSYDIFIPINLTIADVVKLITKSINEITNGAYVLNSKCALYEKVTGQMIDYKLIDTTLHQLGNHEDNTIYYYFIK